MKAEGFNDHSCTSTEVFAAIAALQFAAYCLIWWNAFVGLLKGGALTRDGMLPPFWRTTDRRFRCLQQKEMELQNSSVRSKVSEVKGQWGSKTTRIFYGGRKGPAWMTKKNNLTAGHDKMIFLEVEQISQNSLMEKQKRWLQNDETNIWRSHTIPEFKHKMTSDGNCHWWQEVARSVTRLGKSCFSIQNSTQNM